MQANFCDDIKGLMGEETGALFEKVMRFLLRPFSCDLC